MYLFCLVLPGARPDNKITHRYPSSLTINLGCDNSAGAVLGFDPRCGWSLTDWRVDGGVPITQHSPVHSPCRLLALDAETVSCGHIFVFLVRQEPGRRTREARAVCLIAALLPENDDCARDAARLDSAWFFSGYEVCILHCCFPMPQETDAKSSGNAFARCYVWPNTRFCTRLRCPAACWCLSHQRNE